MEDNATRVGNPPRPPKPPAPSADNTPDELKARKQWVVWRYQFRDGKWTKVPYQPAHPQWQAKTDDPSTWSTFDAAWKALLAGDFDGIGYVFSVDDPYFGVDVDNCLKAGEIQDWAQPYIASMGPSYGEVSPSGKGLKFIARGRLPEDTGTRRTGFGPDGTGALELYDHGRFFTITGDVFGRSKSIADLPDSAVELYRVAKAKVKGRKPAVRTWDDVATSNGH